MENPFILRYFEYTYILSRFEAEISVPRHKIFFVFLLLACMTLDLTREVRRCF